MNRILVIVLRWLVILAMPILLVLGSARIMVNTWYPRYEYAKADFPPDRYGFTQAQRLEFGTVSIDFLNAPQRPEVAIKLLEDQRLPGTENMPLFTVYELGHMVDVKRLTDMLWRVLLGAAIIVVGGLIILLARRSTRPRRLRGAVRRRAADDRVADRAHIARADLLAVVLHHLPRRFLPARNLAVRLD